MHLNFAHCTSSAPVASRASSSTEVAWHRTAVIVHPVVLGNGLPLFHGLSAERPLRLVRTRSFSSGVALLQYDRER